MAPVLAGTDVDLVPVTLTIATQLLAGERDGLHLAPDYPHADTADALGPLVAAGTTAGTGSWLIVRRADGLVIGDLGWVGGPDADGTVEIGYGLAPSARGQGHGSDGVRTLLTWVLAQPGVRRVRAEVLADNAPSRRLLERLGFAVEDTAAPFVHYALSDPGSPSHAL